MSMRSHHDPIIGKRMAQVIAGVVAVMWAVSLVARMANPERYPVPAEVHYLMGAVVAAAFGASAWIPGRRQTAEPPTRLPAPVDGKEHDDE